MFDSDEDSVELPLRSKTNSDEDRAVREEDDEDMREKVDVVEAPKAPVSVDLRKMAREGYGGRICFLFEKVSTAVL